MIPRRAGCSIAGRPMMRADSARQTRKKARLALARIFVPELEEATSSGTVRSQGFSLSSRVREAIGAVRGTNTMRLAACKCPFFRSQNVRAS